MAKIAVLAGDGIGPEIVAEAIGEAAALPAHLAGLLKLEQHVTQMPNDAEQLRAFVAAHAVK